MFKCCLFVEFKSVFWLGRDLAACFDGSFMAESLDRFILVVRILFLLFLCVV